MYFRDRVSWPLEQGISDPFEYAYYYTEAYYTYRKFYPSFVIPRLVLEQFCFLKNPQKWGGERPRKSSIVNGFALMYILNFYYNSLIL